MVSPEEVQKLADLARISIDERDLSRFAKEFDTIIGYVSQLESLSITTETQPVPALRNVMREDGQPHESGRYTEKLITQFPSGEKGYLRVKKIISHD